MSIAISVVGLFFGADLPLTKPVHVLEILHFTKANAAIGNIVLAGRAGVVSAFDFSLSGDGRAVTSFSATYPLGVSGRAIGRYYPPGRYYLPQDLGARPAKTVWQYYVLNEDNTPVVPNPRVRFLDDPDAIVPAGGKLIWRLVSILTGPMPEEVVD